MKIAIPSFSGRVYDHFGHYECFMIYTLNDNNQIIYEEIVSSPNGCGCKSDIVEKLKNIGVKVMLAGNIGGGAVNKLSSHGIAVVRGCSGDIKTVLNEWLNGNIKDNGELCKEHEHHQEHYHEHRYRHSNESH